MDGVWTRTHITCGQVECIWGNYSSTQKIYNSIDNCWDLCYEFDEGMPGERDEYDSNDSDNDTYHPPQSNLPISDDLMPQSILMPAQVSSDCPHMDVDLTPHANPPSMLIESSDPAPLPLSMPLQNPNPQSEDDFIGSDDVEDDEHHSFAAGLKFAVLSEVNS